MVQKSTNRKMYFFEFQEEQSNSGQKKPLPATNHVNVLKYIKSLSDPDKTIELDSFKTAKLDSIVHDTVSNSYQLIFLANNKRTRTDYLSSKGSIRKNQRQLDEAEAFKTHLVIFQKNGKTYVIIDRSPAIFNINHFKEYLTRFAISYYKKMNLKRFFYYFHPIVKSNFKKELKLLKRVTKATIVTEKHANLGFLQFNNAAKSVRDIVKFSFSARRNQNIFQDVMDKFGIYKQTNSPIREIIAEGKGTNGQPEKIKTSIIDRVDTALVSTDSTGDANSHAIFNDMKSKITSI
jgi:hypothetical protein